MRYTARVNFRTSLLIAAGLLAGLALGYLAGSATAGSGLAAATSALYPLEEQGTSYDFVHPLLAYRMPEATTFGQYDELKSTFVGIFARSKADGLARGSVYFRDLGSALWVGIDENETYYPASLLKVPVLIAYMKEAEERPAILRETAVYDPAVMPADPFNAGTELVPGSRYSVEELLRRMIADSDNGATFTLLDRINPEYLNGVYTALGIPNPESDSASYKISARTYGLFFRILYNATYLSAEASEEALRLLSETTFGDGIAAGVPPGTGVSHKWGEHVLSEGGAVTGVELSDCGIVYYPGHPYLLCVMTAADDLETSKAVIKGISEAAYEAVRERYPAESE